MFCILKDNLSYFFCNPTYVECLMGLVLKMYLKEYLENLGNILLSFFRKQLDKKFDTTLRSYLYYDARDRRL